MVLDIFDKSSIHQISYAVTMNILFIILALLIADILFSVVKSHSYSSDNVHNNTQDNIQENTENNFPGLVQEDMLNNFINEVYNDYHINLHSCCNVDNADDNLVDEKRHHFAYNGSTINVIVNPVYSLLPCDICYDTFHDDDF